MMDQQTVSRHINKRVSLDKGVLTYRTLSRELGLTVAEAKTQLGSYVKERSNDESRVKVTWAVSGWLAPVEPKAEDDPMEVDPSQGGTQSSAQAEDQTATAKKRVIVLCTDGNLQAELSRFSPTPSKHVYALSPSTPTIASLAASSSLAHPSTSKAAGDDPSSWKPAPTEGYGTITYPDGPRKRAPTAKGAKLPVKPTTAPTAAAQKAAAKADPKGKGKEPATTKAGGMAGLFAKPTKPAQAARPIGQLGGLFASRDPPKEKEKKEVVVKKGKEKVVPSKRKAEEKVVDKPKEKPKVVKKVSNGIFGEEEVDEDDDYNEEDEAALREMEEDSQGKAKGKGNTSRAEADRQKKELEAMMASDDDDKMVVDPPSKKAPAPAAAKKVVPKKAAQGTLSFSKK